MGRVCMGRLGNGPSFYGPTCPVTFFTYLRLVTYRIIYRHLCSGFCGVVDSAMT